MSHYCLKCGAPLQVQILEKRPREVCPACGWVYYLHLKLGAGVMLEQDGRLLLVRRDTNPWRGSWNLPAGYVEADEPPELAAEREALEETGLSVTTTRLLGAYFFDDDPRGNGLLLLYSACILGGSLQGSSEGRELRFFSPREIPDELSGGAHDAIIRAWQSEKLNVKGKDGRSRSGQGL